MFLTIQEFAIIEKAIERYVPMGDPAILVINQVFKKYLEANEKVKERKRVRDHAR